MKLREATEHIPALGRLMEQIQIMSAPGRRALYASEMLTDCALIERELDANAAIIELAENDADSLAAIRRALMELKEVRGTVSRLQSGEVLDDIELFELKCAALTCVELRSLLATTGITAVSIPDLQPAVDLLDPQHTRVPHFYIYDSYDAELAEVRMLIKAVDAAGGEGAGAGQREELFCRAQELEDRVRVRLSESLHPLSHDIAAAMSGAARLDLIQARAEMALTQGCCRPQISADAPSEFCGLFNPAVRRMLRERGKDFQPVDISLVAGPTVITGANMAGKSVLLKTVALAQALTQFGFNTPAASARIAPVSEILLCIGDEQSELTGLSSFASEMLRIDAILQRLRGGASALVLIDEPARTTNPVEGKALVDALLRILGGFSSPSLLATHYSGLTAPCRRLRVKGFIEERCNGALEVGDINSFIDYSLVEEQAEVVPHEALRIARLLGVDTALLDRAELNLSHN